MRISCIILIVLSVCSTVKAQSSPTCGSLNDPGIHVAAHYATSSEAHYDGSTIAPPASVGGTIADNTYSCTIKRLTNATVAPANGNFCAHEYSNMSAINASDTLVLLSCGSYFITDLSGNVIVPRGNLPWGGGEGCRWDPVNPLECYYIVDPGTGNVLYKLTVPSNYSSCAPTCTVASTTLHTFSEYSHIDFGGGEGDMFSPDHIVLDGMRTSDGSTDIFVYTISTDTKGPVYNFTQPFDNVQITGSNQMVVNWGGSHIQTPFGSCTSGPCLTGFELFGAPCMGVGCTPANANYVRHLSDTNNHSTETRDNNGNDIVVSFDVYPRVPGCGGSGNGGEGGVESIRVDGSGVTCILVATPWSGDAHLSSTKNLTGNNWIEFSDEDGSSFSGSSSASYPLNPNWNQPTDSNNNPTSAGQWGYLSNESAILSPDGSSVYRIFQSRSRPGPADYWKVSRDSISRDGAYVIFDSDFGLGQNYGGVTDYVDAYEVATEINTTSTSAAPNVPQPPTDLTAVVH